MLSKNIDSRFCLFDLLEISFLTPKNTPNNINTINAIILNANKDQCKYSICLSFVDICDKLDSFNFVTEIGIDLVVVIAFFVPS